MKLITPIIPTHLVTNVHLSVIFPFAESQKNFKFSASWWFGNKKYFAFLFSASHALFQRHAEFNYYKRIV